MGLMFWLISVLIETQGEEQMLTSQKETINVRVFLFFCPQTGHNMTALHCQYASC